MNVVSKTVHINSDFHKQRERYAFFVKKYEFDNPDITQVDSIPTDVITDCKDNYFHTFEYWSEYDKKFKHKTSELINYTRFNNFKLFSSQTDRLLRKNEEYEKRNANSMKQRN